MAMGRLNANGAAMGSRQRCAAVKQENGQHKKAQADKKDKEVAREALETRKAGLAVMAKANTLVDNLGKNCYKKHPSLFPCI